jgi:hypothetical protein
VRVLMNDPPVLPARKSNSCPTWIRSLSLYPACVVPPRPRRRNQHQTPGEGGRMSCVWGSPANRVGLKIKRLQGCWLPTGTDFTNGDLCQGPTSRQPIRQWTNYV